MQSLKEFLAERDRRYAERFEDLQTQTPTAADHVALEAKVEILMQSKAMLEGKASQSSVQVVLVLTVLGMMISFCAAGTAILSLILHLTGVI